MDLFPRHCTLCRCVPSEDAAVAVPLKSWMNISEVTVKILTPPSADSVLFVTVATHREPYIELLEQSARRIGVDLHVLGGGEFFKGELTCNLLSLILMMIASYSLISFRLRLEAQEGAAGRTQRSQHPQVHPVHGFIRLLHLLPSIGDHSQVQVLQSSHGGVGGGEPVAQPGLCGSDAAVEQERALQVSQQRRLHG